MLLRGLKHAVSARAVTCRWSRSLSNYQVRAMKIINGKLVPDDAPAAAPAAAAATAAPGPAPTAKVPPTPVDDSASEAALTVARSVFASDAEPTSAQLRSMLGAAAEEAGLNIVCRVPEYDALLQAKIEVVRALFAKSDTLVMPADLMVHTSPKYFFRMRTDFRTWHRSKVGKPDYRMFYAMFPKNDPRRAVEVPAFPMGSRRVNELMEKLRTLVLADQMLLSKLYEVRFLTTLAGASLAANRAKTLKQIATGRASFPATHCP